MFLVCVFKTLQLFWTVDVFLGLPTYLPFLLIFLPFRISFVFRIIFLQFQELFSLLLVVRLWSYEIWQYDKHIVSFLSLWKCLCFAFICKILEGCRITFFQLLKILGCHGFCFRVTKQDYYCFFEVNLSFIPLSMFSSHWFLAVFPWCVQVCEIFIRLTVCRVSWICGWMSSVSFEIFLASVSSDNVSAACSCLSWDSRYRPFHCVSYVS